MRSWLGVFVALVVGLALGYAGSNATAGSERDDAGDVLARSTETGSVDPRHPEPNRASQARQVRLLEDLTLEVRTLRSELRERGLEAIDRSPTERDSRTPAEENDEPSRVADIDPEVARWMARIDARLADLAKSPGSLPVLTLPAIGVRPTPLPLPEPADEDQERFGASHLLWSYQDVLQAYGRPDIVNDGTEWEYRYKGEAMGEAQLADVHFVFEGGYVVHVYAH